MRARIADGDEVRVYEKDEQGVGKDIRVWTVRRGAGDVYTAEHCAHVPHPTAPTG